MRLGLQVSSFTWPDGAPAIGATLARVARNAESANLASLWVMDHFFQIEMVGPAEDPMLEAYSTLSYIAGITERIELGTLVTGVTYRYPGLLLKTVSTLDVLSGGRAWLGIGAAWNEQEHLGLGVPFPPLKTRFEQLEETLRLAKQMFADDDSPFEGTHYQLQRPMNHPAPLRRVPILIGGSGEKKTLRLVAQYADACNLFDSGDPAAITHKLNVLKRHCDEVGRNVAEIDVTVLSPLAISQSGRKNPDGTATQTVAQVVDRFGALGAVGVTTVLLGLGSETVNDAVYPLLAEVGSQLA